MIRTACTSGLRSTSLGEADSTRQPAQPVVISASQAAAPTRRARAARIASSLRESGARRTAGPRTGPGRLPREAITPQRPRPLSRTQGPLLVTQRAPARLLPEQRGGKERQLERGPLGDRRPPAQRLRQPPLSGVQLGPEKPLVGAGEKRRGDRVLKPDVEPARFQHGQRLPGRAAGPEQLGPEGPAQVL